NASFMGFAPVTNPAIVVVVTLNGTSGGQAGQGGRVAAPVFRTVAMEALRVLDVPKDIPEQDPIEIEDAPEESDLAIADLSDPPPLEEPAAGPPIIGPAPPPVIEKQKVAQATGPRVPNFQGKTMRPVVEEADA